MLLHVLKEKVDNLNMIDIANEFVSANESWLSTFGKFSEHVCQTQVIAINFVYALKQAYYV